MGRGRSTFGCLLQPDRCLGCRGSITSEPPIGVSRWSVSAADQCQPPRPSGAAAAKSSNQLHRFFFRERFAGFLRVFFAGACEACASPVSYWGELSAANNSWATVAKGFSLTLGPGF
jgi:hypothetical protein